MKPGKRHRVVISATAGAVLGFFLLHPYTMLVFGVTERHGVYGSRGWFEHLAGHLRDVITTFEPGMLHMGIPYALLGAFAGLFFGFWLEARREKEEMEKRACAVDTMRQLMVTLSHYLLNASTIIGGYACHIQKKEDDEDKRKHLEVIKTEAECVEAVVKSLQSLSSITTEHYTKDSETMIIDIQKQLEERIKESVGKKKAALEKKAA